MENAIPDYGENVAAISALIHQEKASYEELYHAIADDVGGFVGIWDLCAEAGKVFSIEECHFVAGKDFYRIEAIEEYAHQLRGFLEAGTIPDERKMHNIAAGAIEKYKM